jgi:predicted nucleic acid-binding OB-fold protein
MNIAIYVNKFAKFFIRSQSTYSVLETLHNLGYKTIESLIDPRRKHHYYSIGDRVKNLFPARRLVISRCVTIYLLEIESQLYAGLDD